jgi:hypothetical protein
VNPEVGIKLRFAYEKIEGNPRTEDLQSAMIHIRDAWIELMQWICHIGNIDTSDISSDAVVDRFKKLEIDKTDDKLFNLARASFNLSMKHHDRDISTDVAIACVISTIVSMKTVITEVLDVTPSN